MMFGQQPYVYQQPIYNQPPMMQEPMMRPQYQPTPQYPTPQPQPQQPSGGQSIIWVPNEKAANEFIVAPNNAVTLWDMNAPVVYVKKAISIRTPAWGVTICGNRIAGTSKFQFAPPRGG